MQARLNMYITLEDVYVMLLSRECPANAAHYYMYPTSTALCSRPCQSACYFFKQMNRKYQMIPFLMFDHINFINKLIIRKYIN